MVKNSKVYNGCRDRSTNTSYGFSTGMFGDQIRVASTYTDAAGADGTVTFSVKAFLKR